MTTQELIEQTKKLIAIESTVDNPRERRKAVDFVRKMVEERCPGITTELFESEGNFSFLAYRGAERPRSFDVLLNAHVDVVPAKPEQFKAEERNGRLYGRGALDMKGTAVVLANAFCQNVMDVPYKLALQVVSDEEVSGRNCTRYQIEQGVRADFVVVGEYANHRHTIYNAARGICWVEVAFAGKTAHGGHLWNGSNALLKATNFANAVLSRYPTPEKETWATTANIASISTPNETYNRVPDQATVKIDFRFTQEDPAFQNIESLRKFIKSIDPEARLVNVLNHEPAVKAEQLNPYVQGLSRAHEKVTGQPTQFLGRPGGSDGRHFAEVSNDIVEYGLYGMHPHSDKEYVELASFGEYARIIDEFLKQPLPRRTAKREPASKSKEPLDIALLRGLIAMPTVTGDLAGNNLALDYIDNFLSSRGMHVRRKDYEDYGTLVATTHRTKKPKVMLTAHLDVVPASESHFTMQRKDGKLYGRGVWDMKNAIASYMALVDELKDNLKAYDFGIMIFTDDEGRDLGVENMLEDGYSCEVSILPDGSDDWQLESGAKGALYAKVKVAGKSVHGSRPWQGDSASLKLLHLLNELSEHFTEQAPHSDTLNIGRIRSGQTWNQLPENAEADVDIRSLTLEKQEQALALLKHLCKKYSANMEIVLRAMPVVHDFSNPYMHQFAASIERVIGIKNVGALSHGGSDANRFMRRDIPCVVFRPTGNGLHGENEWIDEQGYLQMRPVLKDYLEHVARVQAVKAPAINNSRKLSLTHN